MSNAIHDLKLGSGDILVSNGYYAVNAAGHLVLIPPGAPLKSSMRLAVASDFAPGVPQSPPDAAPEAVDPE